MFARSAFGMSMDDFKTTIEPVVDKEITAPVFEKSELRTEGFKIDKNEDKVEMLKKENVRRENIETQKLKQDRNDFDTLRVQFLQHKNKPLFIKKNKHVIKNLDTNDQKLFIELAKGVLN